MAWDVCGDDTGELKEVERPRKLDSFGDRAEDVDVVESVDMPELAS